MNNEDEHVKAAECWETPVQETGQHTDSHASDLMFDNNTMTIQLNLAET